MTYLVFKPVFPRFVWIGYEAKVKKKNRTNKHLACIFRQNRQGQQHPKGGFPFVGQWLRDRVVRDERISTMADSSAPRFTASLLALMKREVAPLTYS